MKNISKNILLCTLLAGLIFTSCEFLDVDRYFHDTFQQDSIFARREFAEGYLWHTPTHFPSPASMFTYPWTLGSFASDELSTHRPRSEFVGMQFSIGAINERNMPSSLTNVWRDMYRVIRRTNIMLEEVRIGDPTSVPGMTDSEKMEYRANVYFMRAWANYHLLMNWGPLLIIDNVVDNAQPFEYYNRMRATMDESIEWIIADLERAAAHLPMPGSLSLTMMERPTRGAALALIARLRLKHASPLWNGGEAARRSFGDWIREDGVPYVNTDSPDPRRWALAAAAARVVLDLDYELHKVDLSALNPSFVVASNVYGAVPEMAPELIDDPENPGQMIPNPDPYAPLVPTGRYVFTVENEMHDPMLSFHNMFNGATPWQVNPEFIWAHPANSVILHANGHSFPWAFGASSWASAAVPWRVVESFRMYDGTPFNVAAQNPARPYLTDFTIDVMEVFGGGQWIGNHTEIRGNVPAVFFNRDPRFYASLHFPGRVWPMTSITDATRRHQQYWGAMNSPGRPGGASTGRDGPGLLSEYFNVTGFAPIKSIHPEDARGGDGNAGSFQVGPKPFPTIRLAEMLLIYAEALNELEGSHTVSVMGVHGVRVEKTVSRDVNVMRETIGRIRFRAGMPDVTNEELATTESFRETIKNERQVELFNEGHRFFDTRRWGIFLDQDAVQYNWRGFNVFAERGDGFEELVLIGVNHPMLRERVALPRMVLLPLPHAELLRIPRMSQNPGWGR